MTEQSIDHGVSGLADPSSQTTMEDPRVPAFASLAPGACGAPLSASLIAQLNQWQLDAMAHYRAWLRALPAGRGPHTEAAEAHHEAALRQLHDEVLRGLSAGAMPIDLRAHDALLNAMPGADISALLWIVSGGKPGRVQVTWPQTFLSAWRGGPQLLGLVEPVEAGQGDNDSALEFSQSDDSTDESNQSDADPLSTEDDSDNDQALFQARDAQGRLDMLLNHFCDRWFDQHDRLLADARRVTNSQWLDVQDVLAQICRDGGRRALTVDLSVQWPPGLLLSLHELLDTLRHEITTRQLGVPDLQWQMADPLVPASLRTTQTYLDLCRLKTMLEELTARVRAWVADQANALPKQMRDLQMPLTQILAESSSLVAAERLLLDALDKMHDGQGSVVDLSASVNTLWQKDLRQKWPGWISAYAHHNSLGWLLIRWT